MLNPKPTDMEARRQLLLQTAKRANTAPEPVTAGLAAGAGQPIPPAEIRRDKRKPRPTLTDHLKGFRLRAGDRPIILDRKAISFVCPEIDHPGHTVIGMKLFGARPVIVTTPYDEVVKWWLGDDAPSIPPPAPKAVQETSG